jgi:hypothetical protein
VTPSVAAINGQFDLTYLYTNGSYHQTLSLPTDNSRAIIFSQPGLMGNLPASNTYVSSPAIANYGGSCTPWSRPGSARTPVAWPSTGAGGGRPRMVQKQFDRQS